MADVTTTIKYSCTLCGLQKVSVVVPARGEEDVLVWMDATGLFLSDDHRKRSPACQTKELQDVMIPMSGTDRVGGPALQ
jgi:hypothetical protein